MAALSRVQSCSNRRCPNNGVEVRVWPEREYPPYVVWPVLTCPSCDTTLPTPDGAVRTDPSGAPG